MGKTTFAISFTRKLAEKGHKICYLTLGEDKDKWLEKYAMGDTSGNGVYASIEIVDEVPQAVDDIEKIIQGGDPDLLIVDYLQLIDRGEGDVKTVEKSLAALADKYSLPVMVLSQLGRQIEKRKDHKPKVEDLDSIGLDSELYDQVFLLYRKHYYFLEAAESDLLVILKDREEQLIWDYPSLSVL